jgi:putative aldouronate transport system permease protein
MAKKNKDLMTTGVKVKKSRGERIFNVCNIILLSLFTIACIYPFWYVICASFSNGALLMSNTKALLLPVGWSTAAYQRVFTTATIWRGYGNTIIYVGLGTFINIIMTLLAAYFLSRKDLPGKTVLTILIMFTMYFSGGMIPGYLNIKSLGLYDTRWALLLSGALSTYNLIIMRTAISSIDASLEESAMLDGAGHLTILFKILVPLVKATIAVLVLYYGVGHWNSWFNAMIYLEDKSKQPLQLVLRQILILSDMTDAGIGDDAEQLSETIKYATIIVSTAPILALYPFLQKYFTKGVMVGAVKG